MSPRSEEFMDRSRARLRGARSNLGTGEFELALGAAYYACLYAARAALSERDAHAKTHSGTWGRFGDEFVSAGGFDPDLARAARKLADLREKSDYDARLISPEEASDGVEVAARFLDAVDTLLS